MLLLLISEHRACFSFFCTGRGSVCVYMCLCVDAHTTNTPASTSQHCPCRWSQQHKHSEHSEHTHSCVYVDGIPSPQLTCVIMSLSILSLFLWSSMYINMLMLHGVSILKRYRGTRTLKTIRNVIFLISILH